MTSENYSEDLHQGRGWLNRAAEMLDSCEDHVSDAEFARAAAAIGSGFVDLASVELQAKISAASAQENARIFELQSVIAEAHEAMADRMRAEQAEIELRTAKLAELDVATLAAAGLPERRAEAEARPHDDEPVNLCETDADLAARFAGQIGELTSRIEDALSWFHEPDDATPEVQLAKIRAALTGQSRRG